MPLEPPTSNSQEEFDHETNQHMDELKKGQSNILVRE